MIFTRSTYCVLYVLLFLTISLTNSQAQPNRPSEAEVNIQKIFIDASREKILGNYEDAATLYLEVLKKDKENHAAAYELARVYDVLDNNEKALKSIKMAVVYDKGNMWYQMFLADMFDKTGSPSEAASIYGQLAKLYPETDFHFFKQAFYHVKAKEIDKAVKVYDDVEKRFGVSQEVSKKKHALYVGTGNEKKAAAELQNLAKQYPKNIAHKHLLADYLNKIGNKSAAKDVYKKILQLDPEDGRARIALADSAKQGGDDSSYLSSLKDVFKNPEVGIDVKIKELIPYIHKIADTKDQALTSSTLELAEIIEITHPSEAKAFSVHGDLLYYSGNLKDALNKYQETIKLDNSVFTVWEQMMYIHTDLNDFEGLAESSEKAMDLFPNHAKAYYFNGIANNSLRKHNDAVSSLQQALMMSGKNTQLKADIYSKLGQAYFGLKKVDKADNSFEKAIELNPKNYQVLNTYSYNLALRGKELDKAKEYAAQANELSPNNPGILDTYGWVLYKQKDYKEAKSWLDKAIQNGGEKMPNVLEHYGDVLYQLDEIDNAMIYWQKAQEKGANSDLLEKKIANKKLFE